MEDEILILIRDCQSRYKKINDWERDFISNINHHYSKRGTLTQSQKETLDKIWEKATA